MQTFGQFVAIDFRAVVDGSEHISRLQCLPTLLFFVPGCIEQHEVRVQLRVKSAGRGMQEGRTNEVASGAILFLNATFADSGGGERFQFTDGHHGRFLVCFDDTPVIHGDGQNRNGFGRRTNEVEINPTLLEFLWRQLISRHWMLVIAEVQERFTSHHATRLQSQSFRPNTQPLTVLRLFLRIVIVVGKMLVKIRLRTRPILLWYAAKHKSAFYAKVIQPIGMNSLQPDIPVSVRIPLIMVETVAPSSKRIAPREAQS